MSNKINWITGAVMALLGVIFLIEAQNIPPAYDYEVVGPSVVPTLMSIILIGAAAVQIFQQFMQTRRERAVKNGDSAEVAVGPNDIVLGGLLRFGVPVICFMVLYGLMHGWFGFLLSTFITAFLVLRFFGNGLLLSLGNATGAAAVFYFIFIKLLGTYDAPGRLIDLSNIF